MFRSLRSSEVAMDQIKHFFVLFDFSTVLTVNISKI